LTEFSGADFVEDVDGRKSTTGVIFFVANNPVTWQSSKQRVVAQSSYKSEYIAAASATCQALWLAQVVAEVQASALSTSLLRVDNQSTIALIKNLVLHRQSKHVEVKYHLARESVENSEIEMEFIKSKDQSD
jgi:hypothetical protein